MIYTLKLVLFITFLVISLLPDKIFGKNKKNLENSSCNIDGGDSIIIYVLSYFKNVGFTSLHSF